MSFEANYPGECQECGEWFSRGDLIERHIDGYQHAKCVATTDEDTRGAACTRCMLIHRGECW